MKWKKIGLIFNPCEHKLANNCIEFAQSPQVICFKDFVRIYFSTREKDNVGKYKSHVSFIDMDNNLNNIKNICQHTVIELGDKGCFDEHGIFPFNVLKNKDKILAYTTGWNRRTSVGIDASIGLAISDDNGLTFKKVGNGPVLTSSLYEPFLIGDGFVSIYNNLYHMWYIRGTNWIKTEQSVERVYKITHASSYDGIIWEKDNNVIIKDKIGPEECQALPSVLWFNNRYHMFFCYRYFEDFRNNHKKSYRIGYAYSNDLKNWIRKDEDCGIDVSESGWDSEMICYPHVFELNGKIYMLYNGNNFGKYGFGLSVLEE